MATNDFLVFCGGAGANVLSQADWAALAQRPTGFQSGIAKSAQLNKAWRQSSIMAAVLGQFIADQSGQNAVDDGTTTALLTNLIAAVRASSTQLFTGTNQNLSASGYQKLPGPQAGFAGGLMLQWGSVSATNGLGNVTFPIAFPTALVGVFIGETSGAGNPNVWGIRSQTRTGFIGVVCDLTGAAITDGSYYYALGY